MTIIILLAVALGIATGYTVFPSDLYYITDYIMDIGLCLLLLFVGIDIGKQKNIVNEIKEMGVTILVIPILIGLGSIVGAMIGGLLLGMPFNESGSVGAGFGWYSLAPVILSDYSSSLSAVAFLSNLIREVLAIITVPFIAKYIGYIEAVAPGGATSMDTTLPIITKYTDSKTAVLAFISGVVLSTLVPIIVPIIIAL
jgi:uncharacterized membrane protein YbjE (DUF340 family)